jgi:hypothetical protein
MWQKNLLREGYDSTRNVLPMTMMMMMIWSPCIPPSKFQPPGKELRFQKAEQREEKELICWKSVDYTKLEEFKYLLQACAVNFTGY